jgi:protein-tyrosine phosphatase
MKPEIYKIEPIGSGILFVMPRPSPHEWLEDDIRYLKDFGINRIISLLEKSEEIEIGLANESALANKHSLEFVSYPIKDRGLPGDMKDYLNFTKSLYETIAGGKNTVIHCRAGIGRTGIIAAGVLLHAGFEADDAIAFISSKRNFPVPDTEAQYDWICDANTQLMLNAKNQQ